MWSQISAIAFAQFRIMRNHLPRTNVGSVLMWLFSTALVRHVRGLRGISRRCST